MTAQDDLIDFDVIEGQKENIQSLPGGRSARKLAELYSTSPLHKLSTPTPSDTKNVNDCIRAEYEAELLTTSESDDPLDIYDRYVRWTVDAYPSAQATPQSQLHTLLERATKAFINSAQYKNDPRYLKLWLHYIRYFSDAPRETFVFLSRHEIGETLALFYEDYAEWLESAGRWAQSEEVYKLGIEREARPVQRLMRKFKEFEERQAQQPEEAVRPSSPALPTIRPALVAKVDPFGSATHASTDPQASRPGGEGAGASSRPARAKMAIFSDADTAPPPALSSRGSDSKGWDTIGSSKERKKENTVAPKPWAGETLAAGGKKPSSSARMAVFRDPSLSRVTDTAVAPSSYQVTVHPILGTKEHIFVNLSVIYPTPDEPGTELSFEEIIAFNRGLLDRSWDVDEVEETLTPDPIREVSEIEDISHGFKEKMMIRRDEPIHDENGHVVQPPQPSKMHKKKKTMEANATQIIKAKLDSPSGPKLRKKNNAEPTMTLHTKAATDDIYDIFNAPLQPAGQEEEESAEDDDYETDGDYTTDAESTGTTRNVDADEQEDGEDDVKSISEWSEFSTRRHVPDLGGEEETKEISEDQSQDLIDMDDAVKDDPVEPDREPSSNLTSQQEEDEYHDNSASPDQEMSSSSPRTTFVPTAPEDYEPPTRPFRDAAEVANNRLPFMTPITERTEWSLDVDVSSRRLEQIKTPSKKDDLPLLDHHDESDLDDPLSSPLCEDVDNMLPTPVSSAPLAIAPFRQDAPARVIPQKGPIILDSQCNPVEESVRKDIMSNAHPPLSQLSGFFDHHITNYGRGPEIRRAAKALSKAQKSGIVDRTSPLPAPAIIEFRDCSSSYQVKRELGVGAFAPVYLVQRSVKAADVDENHVVNMGKNTFTVNHRSELEALKMEHPPTAWEFYVMRLAHDRLGPQHRVTASLSYAHEMHLYRDEVFLFLPFHPHGTLLEVINIFRAEASGLMDEQLSMFFAIELLRTVEALHAKSIMHGDLKPDNCLLRLDSLASDEPLSNQYCADGTGGWSSRGVVLIDFGRGIDMRAFKPDVEFIADWKTSAQDCAEMREGRPWTWQIDYHGLAGIIYCLLFGKYIETVRTDQGGLGKTGRRYKIRESLKRYWQADLWGECFDVLLNPTSYVDGEDGAKMPVLRSMKRVRERMESWLQANSERGIGLKSLIGRLEANAKGRKTS